MPAIKQSNIGLWQGWIPGEDGWGDEMNYNLRATDALVQASVIDTVTAPPGTPSSGDLYIVGSGGSGAFSGKDNQLARYDGSAWEFYAPKNGWRVYHTTDGNYKRYDGSAWVSYDSESAVGGTVPVRTSGGQIVIADPTANGHAVSLDYAESNYEKKRQNNLNATTDPGVNDDAAAGYETLSRWVNTATGELWVCLDATNGAANWGKSTLTLDELGSAALVDVGTASDQIPTNADLNINNWNTAYGWGDHSQAGYALAANISAVGFSGNASDLSTTDGDAQSDIDSLQAEDAKLEAQRKFDESATLIMDYANNRYEVYEQFNGKTLKIASQIETFSRGSGKTGFTPTGLAEAAAGVPLNVIDPETGEPLGRSIHEQRTNLYLSSEELTGSSWIRINSLVGVSTVKNPFGEASSFKLIDSAQGSSYIYQSAQVETGKPYTISFFAKKAEYNEASVIFFGNSNIEDARITVNLVTGDLVSQTSAVESYKIKKYPNGWLRISLTKTATGTGSMNSGVLVSGDLADGTSGIYVWGAQLEQGSFPTPYTKAEGTQVTRQADVCSIDNIDQSDWWNPNEGTFVVEFENNRTIPEARILYVSATAGGNYSNLIGIKRTASGALLLEVRIENTESARIQLGVMPEGKNIIAFKFNLASCAISFNGGPVSSLALSAGFPGNLERLYLGTHRDGNLPLNSEFKAIKYKPKAVSDAELQELSQL